MQEITNPHGMQIPPPPAPPREGIFLPTQVVVALLLASAGLAAAYVFATKVELGAERTRISVLERSDRTQDEAIRELKATTKSTDMNLRTLLLREGVPREKIATPESVAQEER